MSKTPEVKAGMAPISRAMKMLPSIPTSTPLRLTQATPLQSAIQDPQDPKPTTSRANILEEMNAAIERRGASMRFEEDDVPRENTLNRAAHIGVAVDSNISRNIVPLAKTTPAPKSSEETDQKNSLANYESQASAAAPLSMTLLRNPAGHGRISHWSTAFGDCPAYAIPFAVYNLVQGYISVESFDGVLHQAISRGRRSDSAMIQSAVNEQLHANQQLVAWVDSYVQSGMGSYVDLLGTSLPAVAYSIVLAAVRRLPGPQQARMEAAVAEQLKVNCRRAVYRASVAYSAPQIGWSGAAWTQFDSHLKTHRGRNNPQ